MRLVLTDIMMAGMDGLALIRVLRGLEPSLPIIASSGLDHSERQAEFSSLGVVEILLKSLTPARLINAVQRALATRV